MILFIFIIVRQLKQTLLTWCVGTWIFHAKHEGGLGTSWNYNNIASINFYIIYVTNMHKYNSPKYTNFAAFTSIYYWRYHQGETYWWKPYTRTFANSHLPNLSIKRTYDKQLLWHIQTPIVGVFILKSSNYCSNRIFTLLLVCTSICRICFR